MKTVSRRHFLRLAALAPLAAATPSHALTAIARTGFRASEADLFPSKGEINGDSVVVRFGREEAACPNFFNKAGLPATLFHESNPFAQASAKHSNH